VKKHSLKSFARGGSICKTQIFWIGGKKRRIWRQSNIWVSAVGDGHAMPPWNDPRLSIEFFAQRL
jgi:hypothetical protein